MPLFRPLVSWKFMLQFRWADSGKDFTQSANTGGYEIKSVLEIVLLEHVKWDMREVLLELREERRVLHINFGLLLGLLGHVEVGLVKDIRDQAGVEWAELVVIDLLPEHLQRLVGGDDAVLGELGEALFKIFAQRLYQVRIGSLRPLSNAMSTATSPEKR